MALAVVAWGLPTMADLVSLDLREHGEAGSKKTLSLSAGVEAGVLQIGVLPSGSARTRRLEIGDELELRLFEDVCITLQIVEQSESPLGGRTFVARALGQSGLEAANAVVVETVDGLQVDIHDYEAAKIYTVFSNREGVIVKEIDLTAGKVLPSAPLIPE